MSFTTAEGTATRLPTVAKVASVQFIRCGGFTALPATV